MQDRLRELGYTVDLEQVFANAARDGGRAVGRPQLADALVAAGAAADRREAFDTLLGEGRPAFVARTGATVSEVASMVQAAGGIASLAHPALMRRDEAISGFVEGGLNAIEVWHSDHDESASARYHQLAEQLGIGMSGGSDYHADQSHHAAALGSISLPQPAFADLEARSDGHARPGRRSR
jgi:predicted metal-dependent phosphoesterase TrpH